MNRKILFDILRYIGVFSNVVAWFDSYLKDRPQTVTVCGDSSDPKPVVIRMEQWFKAVGPILSPILLKITLRIAYFKVNN